VPCPQRRLLLRELPSQERPLVQLGQLVQLCLLFGEAQLLGELGTRELDGKLELDEVVLHLEQG